jgi:hypothetical protein
MSSALNVSGTYACCWAQATAANYCLHACCVCPEEGARCCTTEDGCPALTASRRICSATLDSLLHPIRPSSRCSEDSYLALMSSATLSHALASNVMTWKLSLVDSAADAPLQASTKLLEGLLLVGGTSPDSTLPVLHRR